MSTNFAELGQNSLDVSFFPFRGTPWIPKPRKTRGFLTAPRWNSDTPNATKHRKTRCFLTPRTKNTVIYRGSGGVGGDPEVTMRWPPWGRRLGRLVTITFGYQPKASGKGTGQRPWGRRPDLRATAHAADPWVGPLQQGGPLRNPAKDGFSLRLSPDLGGVWLFCIHCREVAALGVSGLGCVTFSVYVLGLVSSPLGAPIGATSQPCEGRFFASSEPGFRWCLTVLHPLPRGCRFGCVRARLRHVFCLRTGAFFFSFRGSRGATRNPAKDGFSLSLSPDLGGVWLFCIHCREVAALGVSGLGCVTFSVYVLGLVSSPLEFPEVPFRNPAKDRFLLRLSPDLGGVWLFCIHCREVAAWGLSGLGCVTFSVYVLGLFSSPLGAPKVPLRNPAKDGFSLRLSPDLGGFCIHCRQLGGVLAKTGMMFLGVSGLGCVAFSEKYCIWSSFR